MLPVKCYPHRKLKAEVYYAYYISGSIEKSPLKEVFELNSSPYYLPLLKKLIMKVFLMENWRAKTTLKLWKSTIFKTVENT